jgi:hypothetical protein
LERDKGESMKMNKKKQKKITDESVEILIKGATLWACSGTVRMALVELARALEPFKLTHQERASLLYSLFEIIKEEQKKIKQNH